jgi:hypothetical protein
MARRKSAIIVGVLAPVVLLVIAMALKPPLRLYTDLALSPHELPTRLVRLVFEYCTGSEMPGPPATTEVVDEETLAMWNASGVSLFVVPPQRQERFGVSLFDQSQIGCGRVFRHGQIGGAFHEVFIDDRHMMVYVLACPRT